MTTTTVTYEKETCGRCAGTGSHSYNQVHGSTCFGCGGSGQKLTKRGKAAKEFADAMLEILVQDVVIGQHVSYRDPYNGKTTRVTVREINSFASSKKMVDGEWVPVLAYTLLGETHKIGPLGTGIRVRLTPTAEHVAKIAEYQDSLTKTGKPRQ